MKVNKIEQAKQTLEQEKKQRAENCMKQIQELLKKHDCDMIISGRFVGNQIETQINISAK